MYVALSCAPAHRTPLHDSLGSDGSGAGERKKGLSRNGEEPCIVLAEECREQCGDVELHSVIVRSIRTSLDTTSVHNVRRNQGPAAGMAVISYELSSTTSFAGWCAFLFCSICIVEFSL